MASTQFDWLDYLVFGAMLVVSSLIGVYFAFFAKQKQNTTAEYLTAGKSLGVFPMSMSLIASYISGITLLGFPAEMYTYGTQLWMVVASEWAVSLTIATIYLPVFYDLQITSSYEYLSLRFNRHVRLLGSVIFVIKMLLYIPIVIYVPALAMSQVTGVNLHMITPIVCVVCIFYTTLGGIRAVVWTDTLQTLLMYVGVVVVLSYGTWRLGGFAQVWRAAQKGDRLEFFNMDPDPTQRHTFWTTVFGNYFNWLATCAVNQSMVQRYVSLSSLTKANITAAIMAVGIMSLVTFCCYTGLVIYATFGTCDPLSSGSITKSDQLMPFYVMHISGTVPALPGIFMSGVFSAALSTMSTGLNSMTGVILEDFVRPAWRKPISESTASFIMKIIVIITGAICVFLVLFVEKMGGLIQVGKSLSGITAGSLLGMFTMGLFIPWVNSTGALAGGLFSTLLVGWISLGTQAAMLRGDIFVPTKPVSVEGCLNLTRLDATTTPFTLPAALDVDIDRSGVFFLYRISYLYYTVIGMLTCILVGVAVSYFTEPNDPSMVHRKLLTPLVRRWLPPQDSRCEHPRNPARHIEMQPIDVKKDVTARHVGLSGVIDGKVTKMSDMEIILS